MSNFALKYFSKLFFFSKKEGGLSKIKRSFENPFLSFFPGKLKKDDIQVISSRK